MVDALRDEQGILGILPTKKCSFGGAELEVGDAVQCLGVPTTAAPGGFEIIYFINGTLQGNRKLLHQHWSFLQSSSNMAFLCSTPTRRHDRDLTRTSNLLKELFVSYGKKSVMKHIQQLCEGGSEITNVEARRLPK